MLAFAGHNSFLSKSRLSAKKWFALTLFCALFFALISPPANAANSYDCSTGSFTVDNLVVTSNASCSGLAVIPNGITSIGANAFKNATALTSVTIPTSVISIGANAAMALD